MQRVFIIALLLLIITFSSCDKPVEDIQYQVSDLPLHYCADTAINGHTVRICFDSLISDSRCPINATCIWAGEATAKLSIHVEGEEHSFRLSTLNAPPQYRNDTTVWGYQIKLLSISPHPGGNLQGPYRVQLSVNK